MINKVSGQLMVRDADTVLGGRRIIYVVGILAVPASFDLKSHHLYQVHGVSDGASAVVSLLGGSYAEDRTDYKDTPPGELLERPSWRV